jgi:hypothetical protein
LVNFGVKFSLLALLNGAADRAPLLLGLVHILNPFAVLAKRVEKEPTQLLYGFGLYMRQNTQSRDESHQDESVDESGVLC